MRSRSNMAAFRYEISDSSGIPSAGVVDAASFARGEKVWFREMTGIKPLTIAEVVAPDFVQAARKAYPG